MFRKLCTSVVVGVTGAHSRSCRFLSTERKTTGGDGFAVSLPPSTDDCWADVGRAIVDFACSYDAGPAAFQECCVAREQLETVVQSIGYDMNVYAFGGLVMMRFLEAGTDVDFVGVTDVEPGIDEAGEIVSRISREMRRLGIRSTALPKARVPVVKVDRVSRVLPGSPLHSLSLYGMFQFTRAMRQEECLSFASRMRFKYNAVAVEWNQNHQFATVQFADTSAVMVALTQVKKHNGVDIPLRLPVEPRNGPELYRFPFDFCLSSTGLRNSYLLSEALSHDTFGRHMLLFLKKWGRSSGVVNSIDGLLSSYAVSVMFVHLLIKVGAIPRVSSLKMADEPQLLPKEPEYRPLHDGSGCDLRRVGYFVATFFQYFGSNFDYANRVICTTNINLTKKTMNWAKSPGLETGKPPFFELAIKDPYGLDNIARNLDPNAVSYVQVAHQLALQSLLRDLKDPAFAISTLTKSAPRPHRVVRTLASRGIRSSTLTDDQLEARHVLKKVEFHQRKEAIERFGQRTLRRGEQQRVAQDLTQGVLGWIRDDGNATGAAHSDQADSDEAKMHLGKEEK